MNHKNNTNNMSKCNKTVGTPSHMFIGGKAAMRNFQNNVKSGNIGKIKAQIKRGSIKKFKL